MKKINIIKENREFDRIIKNNKSYKYKYYIVYLERNNSNTHKFGISVGKKIGNAVIRNKIKRQIKNIIDKKDYQNNFNCIIIVNKNILNDEFCIREKNLFDVFYKLDIVKEK